MGLLDDAIREHLDLKRARGGDPAEIERMEREALGPVRREPTFGATRFPDDEPSGPPRRPAYPEDEPAEYLGYHDSTAPHDEAHLESAGGPHRHEDEFDDDFDHDAPPFGYAEEERPAPRRRFLRRHRPSQPSERRPFRGGFPDESEDRQRDLSRYEEPPYEEWPQHPDEPHAHGELAAEQAPEHWEASEDHPYAEPAADLPPEAPDLHDEDQHAGTPDGPPTEMMTAAEPPPLEFDRPPKRPRFTAEPPSLHGDAEPAGGEHTGLEPATGEVPPSAAETGADRGTEVQETTEFDVARHIAETRHLPDEPPAEPGSPAQAGQEDPDAQEDVLEETPDFLQDTPEHDRLWFEQRPPRDFDF